MKFIATLTFLFILNTSLFAQKEIGFDFDYAVFNYDGDEFYLELYYSFAQNSLLRSTKNDTSFISANLIFELSDSEKKKIVSENYNFHMVVDTNMVLYNVEDLIGVVGFKVPYGRYDMGISVKDNNSKLSPKTILNHINIPSISRSKIIFSDIQLCRKIVQEGADSNSIYFKNSLEAVPNPKSLYDESLPVLYYYTEIYNNIEKNELKNYKIEQVVSNNNKIISFQSKDILINNKSIARAGFINISKFFTGKYNLELSLLDSNNNVIASESKLFYIHHPKLASTSVFDETTLSYIGSEFGVLNEEECDLDFEVSKYLATQSEKNGYESLKDLEAKRKFLFDFWKVRDLSPETPKNEFKDVYKSRVLYANSHYGHSRKKGYRTDRGRVLLVYGKPDQIDTKSNESNLKPHEIWSYNYIEGGISFIFGDTMGFSQLELLHSTKRGEIYNTDWERRLTIKGGY